MLGITSFFKNPRTNKHKYVYFEARLEGVGGRNLPIFVLRWNTSDI